MTALSSRVERLDPRDRGLDQLAGLASPERTSSACAVASRLRQIRQLTSLFERAPQSSCSRPTVKRSGSSPTLRTASSTPGMNERRSIESWRIVSVWPSPPKIDLLVGDEAGQAHRVDRLVDVAAGLADQLGGPLRGARRRVELAVVVQLDDLALGHVRRRPAARPASSARRRSRSSGATKQFASPPSSPRRRSRSSSRSKPVVPTTAWTPASRHARTLPGAASGVVKSTTTSASPSTSASSTPSAGSALPLSSRSSAPSTASTDGLRPSAPRRRRRRPAITLRPAPRSTGASALAEALLARGRCRRPRAAPGRSSSRGQAVDVVDGHRVDLVEHLVEGVDRQVEQRRAGDPRHPRGGRLRGEDQPALDVLLGAGELLVGDAARSAGARARRR